MLISCIVWVTYVCILAHTSFTSMREGIVVVKVLWDETCMLSCVLGVVRKKWTWCKL